MTLKPSAFFGSNSTVAIAHRGGAGTFSLDRYTQENTLKVFRSTVNLGYKYLELDVTNTSDGKVVVLHVSADELEKLLMKPSAPDAHKLQHFSYWQLQKYLGRTIPKLEDVIRKYPKINFLIDAKTDEVVEPLAKIIQDTKSKKRVFINSFYQQRIFKLQQLLGSDLNCGVIIGRHPRLINWRLRQLRKGEYFKKNFTAIVVPRRFASEKLVNLIHDNGLRILIWCPKTKKHVKKAIELRVDGIMSDNVKLLKKVLLECDPKNRSIIH